MVAADDAVSPSGDKPASSELDQTDGPVVAVDHPDDAEVMRQEERDHASSRDVGGCTPNEARDAGRRSWFS